ncbi:hypothetical protein BH10BDE1_BH10BDE1_06550 [soil metagenome]
MTQQKKTQQRLRASLLMTFASSLMIATTACSPGFSAGTAASCASAPCANDSLGGGSGGTGLNPVGWDSVSLDGSISGGRFDKAKAVEIDKVSKTLVIRLPFIAGFSIGAQIPISIPEIPGTTVGIEPNSDGSSALVLRIPLAAVLKGVDTLPSSRLPNGSPLPAIPEGELPSVGVTYNNSGTLKGALYLSPTVVGLFVTTKFDPYIQLTLPIRDAARIRTFGYFTSIPAKPGYDGGFFVSVALPDDLARAIDDLL